MRLMVGLTRMVTLKKRAGLADAARNEDVYTWEPGVGKQVFVDAQPISSTRNWDMLPERLWGGTPDKGLVMYTTYSPIVTGMGVCVGVDGGSNCDYRVTGVEKWAGHNRVYLAFIPENRRG